MLSRKLINKSFIHKKHSKFIYCTEKKYIWNMIRKLYVQNYKEQNNDSQVNIDGEVKSYKFIIKGSQKYNGNRKRKIHFSKD